MQQASTEYKTASYLSAVCRNKCPRCRRGNMFKTNNAYALKNSRYMQMHDKCEVCGQPTEIEVGFYYGTGYVSYALCVALTVTFFTAWYILIGFALDDNRVFWCLGIDIALLILLQPLLMRLSRSLWLSWFVKYDKDWKKQRAQEPERIVPEQMGNW